MRRFLLLLLPELLLLEASGVVGLRLGAICALQNVATLGLCICESSE
jgi:hypothetical protein